ncbi:alpha/beta hydrolase [Microbispora corallina]|uniref:Alpha/beta hydrolase n=1 Tax=Microbispora corallina TaxID=83302 RepID=A0ABQ4G668_9ACTN|nr:alpha/beta hydrolase [Microbispora corallina]GIH42571.1 alpha/beta hydrolase [Microbispora corallina]
MTSKQAVAENEFTDLTAIADDLGLSRVDAPAVQRRWVNVITGGHVSGVSWGTGSAQAVLLHDARRSARAWDALALALDIPTLALDLPGHGRSNWRKDGVYTPRKLAPAVAEAIKSFAPSAKVIAGTGLGALTAIALNARHPDLVHGLVLIDTLPGTLPGRPAEGPTRFASREQALAWLRETSPWAPPEVTAADVRHETTQESDGSWTWRHHLGNLPAEDSDGLDDETLWDLLAAVAARGVPIVVVRPGTGSRLKEASLGELRRRVVTARVVTLAESTGVVESDQSLRLAELIHDVLSTFDRFQGRLA